MKLLWGTKKLYSEENRAKLTNACKNSINNVFKQPKV